MILRAVAFLLSLSLLAGCGRASYEKKFEASLTDLRNEEPFRSLWSQPITIPLPYEGEDLVLQLRVPRLFDTQTGEAYALDQNTLDPRNGEAAIEPDRLWPDFLHLGEHLRTYERTIGVNPTIEKESRVPVRCYVAIASDEKNGDVNKIIDDLRQRCAEHFKNTGAEPEKKDSAEAEENWIQMNVRTPAGKSHEVARGKATKTMPLSWYETAGKPELKQKDFVSDCLIYVIPNGDKTVILAWLMPVGLSQRENIDSPALNPPPNQYPIARAMAGTAKVLQVKSEAKEQAD